jgi:formylglycine-generating enzyme required for sulfatase activity
MLESDVRHRWETLLEKSAKPEDIEAAIALRDRITGIDTEKLSPRSRLNLAIHDLRASVAAAHGDDLEKQIAPAAAKLKQLIGMLDPAEAKQPNIVALATEIDRIGNAAPVDFTHLGPMSDAARDASKVSWSVTAEDSGDKVTYSAALPTDVGKEDVTLIFRRVHPGSTSQSSWVCTTEASLALFSDLITASGKWSEIRSGKMLLDYEPSRGDPRVGPRVWEWPRYGRAPGIVRSMVWLSSDFLPSRLDHYPDSIGSEFNRSVIRDERGERSEELNPSRQQPMQQVSVKAAQLAAAAVGCRIPTVAEWQAAWRSGNQRASGNLRDRTWRLELEHMKKPAFGGQIRPDAGMFTPEGEKPSDAVYPRADGSEFSDGILWFHPVPENAAGFVDLVGNVAEFVSDEAGKIYVIGGSSMSPPGRALDRPFALGADQATSGFSDTGFRLAFSGPASGNGKFRDAVAGNWYLVSH